MLANREMIVTASCTVLESKNDVLLRSFMMAHLIYMMRKVETISPCTISMLLCVGVCWSTIVEIRYRKRKIPAAQPDYQTFLWRRSNWHQPGHTFLRGNTISPLQTPCCYCCCRCCWSESVSISLHSLQQVVLLTEAYVGTHFTFSMFS